MVKVYIGARFSMALACRELEHELKEKGHQVVSAWHMADNESSDDPTLNAQRAMRDYVDLMSADAFVQLLGDPRAPTRGGQHVELGLAIAWNKVVVVVGQPGHVFHHLETICRVDSTTKVDEALRDWNILDLHRLDMFEDVPEEDMNDRP